MVVLCFITLGCMSLDGLDASMYQAVPEAQLPPTSACKPKQMMVPHHVQLQERDHY